MLINFNVTEYTTIAKTDYCIHRNSDVLILKCNSYNLMPWRCNETSLSLFKVFRVVDFKSFSSLSILLIAALEEGRGIMQLISF